MSTRRRIVGLSALGLLVTVAGAIAARQDVRVSGLPGPQNEAAIAVDPSNDRVLLAGSNSFEEGVTRVYNSVDGGVTWTAEALYEKPSSKNESCAADPGVAIDLAGRQYFSFIRATPCDAVRDSNAVRPRLYVSARSAPDAAWEQPVQVAALGRARADDKPAIAVDTSASSPFRGRVYVVWSRIMLNTTFRLLLSFSDDGGRSWSRPARVNRVGRAVTYATIVTSARGVVYVAWEEATNNHVKITRSIDGGRTFSTEQTAAGFSNVTIPHCGSALPLRALGLKCAHPNPILSVDRSAGRHRGRVYLTYTQAEANGYGVRLAVFDARLRVLAGYPKSQLGIPVVRRPRVGQRDQVWAASAVDRSTGALWVCFYDTQGDPTRKRATFSCTASTDGGTTFAKPVKVAAVPSDATQPDIDVRGYGDYEGLAVANGVAHPIWTDTRDNATLSTEIYTATLTLEDLGLKPG